MRTGAALGVIVSVMLSGIAAVSCAAIAGLGDLHEVDCVGAACEGGSSGDPSMDGSMPDAAPLEFATIGGNTTGLLGSGLVLRDNGGDDLAVAKDGPFVFATKVHDGSPYLVTVGTQPSNPAQTCTASSASGIVKGANVTDVDVTCSTSAYSVGGFVVGVGTGGAGLVLTNNGADDLVIGANGGAFEFPKKVASGATFDVQVKTQPTAGGPCQVSGGMAKVGSADVTSVVVNCAPGTYTVGGTITGLNGTAVLQDNGGNDLTLTGNGAFAFSQTLLPSAAYAVTVSTPPAYPPRNQTCTVMNGTGMIGLGNVTNVAVSCTTNAFTIGGDVTGMIGTLLLKDNGGDTLTLTGDGPFTFATSIPSGNTYAVTVAVPPFKQNCSVASGSGTVANGKVTNVAVTCAAAPNYVNCSATSTCSVPSQICCLAAPGPCVLTGAACPGGGQSTRCDDHTDCDALGMVGSVCCIEGKSVGDGIKATGCQPYATCAGYPIHHILCDPALADPCPNGGTCQQIASPTVLTSKYSCR